MKKRFDCIKMKDEIQASIRAEVQGMSRQEELAYYHRLARKDAGLWAKFAKAGAKRRYRTATAKPGKGATVAEWPALYKRPAKKFDCIKMKEECQARVRKETEGMSQAEMLDYYRRAAEKFGERFRKVKRPGAAAGRG